MNYKAVEEWLSQHKITLEQSFIRSVRQLAREYKKTTAFVAWKMFTKNLGVLKATFPVGNTIPAARRQSAATPNLQSL